MRTLVVMQVIVIKWILERLSFFFAGDNHLLSYSITKKQKRTPNNNSRFVALLILTTYCIKNYIIKIIILYADYTDFKVLAFYE